MADENQTSLKSLMIAGVTFEAPYKYAAGHVLNEAEARTLNQTRFENLRNNFASKVKAANLPEGAEAPADLVAKFAEFEAAYEFSVPGTGGGTVKLDPIEREAHALAKEIIKNALANKGKSMNPPKDATDEQKEAYKKQIAEYIAGVAAKDEVIAQAKKNVAARQKGVDALTAGLDL